jgi:hypothetical protein
MKTISVAIGELVNRGLRLERLEAEASKMNQSVLSTISARRLDMPFITFHVK